MIEMLHCRPNRVMQPSRTVDNNGQKKPMARPVLRTLAVLFCAATMTWGATAFAQAPSGDNKPADQKAGQSGEANKGKPDTSRPIDEIAEAARVLTGPAANPECVWLGRRVVTLLWRDDLDTAFRHLDLYDRFGCPGNHIQATFRCVVRQGNIDPKTPETLNARVHSCWINPALQPSAAASAPPPAPTAQAGQNGTNAK